MVGLPCSIKFAVTHLFTLVERGTMRVKCLAKNIPPHPWPRDCRSNCILKVFAPESYSKISNLMITELFYPYILDMIRGSLHTRCFRRIHFSVFRYGWTSKGFAGPKSFWGFQDRDPRALTLADKSRVKCTNQKAAVPP